MKDLVIDEIIHQRLETFLLLTDFFEIIESGKYDLVATFYQTNGRQQFQYQSFRPVSNNRKETCMI